MAHSNLPIESPLKPKRRGLEWATRLRSLRVGIDSPTEITLGLKKN
jgi:hypothetical protein